MKRALSGVGHLGRLRGACAAAQKRGWGAFRSCESCGFLLPGRMKIFLRAYVPKHISQPNPTRSRLSGLENTPRRGPRGAPPDAEPAWAGPPHPPPPRHYASRNM